RPGTRVFREPLVLPVGRGIRGPLGAGRPGGPLRRAVRPPHAAGGRAGPARLGEDVRRLRFDRPRTGGVRLFPPPDRAGSPARAVPRGPLVRGLPPATRPGDCGLRIERHASTPSYG